MSEKSLRELLENDDNLDQAKLVIAAQDVLDRLQKIAEHLAELSAEEIMPLSDNMKAAFGPQVAQEFEQQADSAIQKALTTVRGARDVIDSAILKVQGQMPASDMGNYDNNQTPDLSGNDMADDTEFDTTIDAEADQQMQQGDDTILGGGDGFDGAEAAASGEPEGRSKKESYNNNKTAILENVFKKAGALAIMEESLGSLISWILENKQNKLSDKDFTIFKEHLDVKLKNDPLSVAGWIALQKPKNVKISESIKELTPDQKKAYGIAKVIEANIISYGHGKAAQVVRQFASTDIRENCEKTLTEVFKETFGATPAQYSVSMRNKIMGEDITPSNSPDPSNDGIDSQSNMTSVQKADAAKGIAKIASTVGDNVANTQKPLSTAMADLSSTERSAVDDVVDDIKNTSGTTPSKVSDLLKNASNVIGEEKVIPELYEAYKHIIESLSSDKLTDLVNFYTEQGKEKTALVQMAKNKLMGN